MADNGRPKVRKGDVVDWDTGDEQGGGQVHRCHRDGSYTVSAPADYPVPLVKVRWYNIKAVNGVPCRKVIGGLYRGGPTTVLDPRLGDTFKLWNWPGQLFRVHPDCGGLICYDGEVVVQARRGDAWLDFVREQQSKVLSYLTPNV